MIRPKYQSIADFLEEIRQLVSGVPTGSDFFVHVALGNVPGFRHENKFGRSTNVDNGVDTDIWDRANSTDDQDIWIAPLAARIHQIASTSSADDGSTTSSSSSGTPESGGAKTVRVFGLTDWDTAEVTEDIEMNGTTDVPTANAYVIIHRLEVRTKGTLGANVGNITATADVDGTVTAQINVGQGQTQMAIYGIPSSQTMLMCCFYASFNKSGGAPGAADISLLANREPDVEATHFVVKGTQGLLSTGTTQVQHIFNPMFTVPGPCITKIQASGSVDNLDISAGFDIVLVDNN